MALHMRARIRAAAVLVLTGLATTGNRVRKSPVYPMQPADLPGLRIYTKDEQDEAQSMGGAERYIERTLELMVDCCVKQNSDYDDLLDQISLEVEQALSANQSLGIGVKSITPTGASMDFDGGGEKPVAVLTLSFDVFYVTTNTRPDQAQ